MCQGVKYFQGIWSNPGNLVQKLKFRKLDMHTGHQSSLLISGVDRMPTIIPHSVFVVDLDGHAFGWKSPLLYF